MSFGSKLKRLRKALPGKVTQEDLAALVGIPKGTLRNYEQDIREPTNKNVMTLAKFFGMTVEELMSEADEPPPKPKLGRPPKKEE